MLAYAVGDIHGRADLLLRMIDMLRDDALQAEDVQGRPVLIFLGDYIDRGFQSKAVIDTLNGPAVSDFDTRFLRGNHEAAFLHFLSDSEFGPKWATYGGIETLVSYSVRPPSIRTDEAEWERVRDDLSKALPQGHLAFLQSLENQITLGDYEFVHAGVAPNVALDQQVEDDLLWIRDEFLLNKKRLERVIVHGHTPEAAPYRDNRRIGLDTGAYMSGRLTAARFQGNNVRFLSTT
ncbi:MAG: metallophosphoesterase [Pseudomonadota bacterium]